MERQFASERFIAKNFETVIIFLVVLCSTVSLISGHGALTVPPSKNGGNLAITSLNPTDHFTLASFGIIDKAFFENDHSITPWHIPGKFDFSMALELIPGHKQTLHPCGCNAGDIAQCAGVGIATGFGETTSGATITPPEWAKGSSQDVGWNAWVNHGGGDIFMLCKKTAFDACRVQHLPSSLDTLTDDQRSNYLSCVWNCFESQPLDFEESVPQKLQYQDDKCSYVSIEPLEKAGHNFNIYRFTPIPDSNQVSNDGEGVCTWENVINFSNDHVRNKFIDTFGNEDVCDSGKHNHHPKDWHVIDKVKIPTNISEGEYLLSWRWDAYTADQMWTSCADVTIVNSSNISPSTGEDCTTSPPTTPSPTTVTPPPTTSPPTTTLAPTTSPPTIEVGPTCPLGYSGFLPYDHCTKYFRCDNGNMITDLFACPGGTLFDKHYQYCNWKTQVTCEEKAEGCWSNNFKDCNYPNLQDLPTSKWLPEGALHFCIARWAECDPSSVNKCCEPATCHGNSEYGQCREPT